MLIEEPSMNITFFPITNPAAHHEECDSERGERRDKGGNEALEATQASQTESRHLFQATKSGREVAIPDSLFHHSFLISISAPLTRRAPEAMSAAPKTRTGLLNSCITPRATTESPQSVKTTFGSAHKNHIGQTRQTLKRFLSFLPLICTGFLFVFVCAVSWI